MILAYVGTPGSGKTYEAMIRVLSLLRLGRRIVTNIEGLQDSGCVEAIRLLTGVDYDLLSKNLKVVKKKDTVKIHKLAEPGDVLVIDEVHDFFNARNWASEENKDFASFCATHRHDGYDLVLITQDIDKLDKHVRQMVEWTFSYKKINFFGKFIKNRYMWRAYSGNDTDGEVFTRGQGKYDKKYFKTYKSFTHEGIKELGLETNTNVFKRPIFAVIIIAVIAAIYTGSRSTLWSGDFFGSKKYNENLVAGNSLAKKANQRKSLGQGQGGEAVASESLELVKSEVPKEVENEVLRVARVSDREKSVQENRDIVAKGANGNSQAPGPGLSPFTTMRSDKDREKKSVKKEDDWVWEEKLGGDGTKHFYENQKYVGWLRVEKCTK